jgi:hypothetical protein
LKRFLTALVLLVSASPLAGLVAPAAAAGDTTPPVLNLPAEATYVWGSEIGETNYSVDNEPLETDDIAMRASWTATDPSGICGSSWRAVYAGQEPGPWTPWTSALTMTQKATDYSDQEGGGSFKILGYDVRVRDCLHNITRKFVSFNPAVFQEDGSSYGYGGVTTSYGAAWKLAKCLCWSAHATRYSTTRGARFNFTIDHGGPVGLVMEKAPNRGRIQVLVDGILRGSTDTFALTPQHRSVVWVGTLRSGRSHTVTVVNQATPGRPRVNVDALLADPF